MEGTADGDQGCSNQSKKVNKWAVASNAKVLENKSLFLFVLFVSLFGRDPN